MWGCSLCLPALLCSRHLPCIFPSPTSAHCPCAASASSVLCTAAWPGPTVCPLSFFPAPAPADDMVIEYVGELVRPSVSDLRCVVGPGPWALLIGPAALQPQILGVTARQQLDTSRPVPSSCPPAGLLARLLVCLLACLLDPSLCVGISSWQSPKSAATAPCAVPVVGSGACMMPWWGLVPMSSGSTVSNGWTH